MKRPYRSSEQGRTAPPPAPKTAPRKRPKRPAKAVVDDVLSGATENRRAAQQQRAPAGRVGQRKVGRHGYTDTPLCGAKKRDGTPCRMFAGQGTNHTGIGACFLHGGTMGASKKKAARVKVEQELTRVGNVATMSDPMDGDVDPVAVLMEFLRVSIARTRWLDKKLTTLPERALYDIQGQVLTRLDGDERDRGARAARYCIESGVPALRVRLEEGQSELVARMIRRALERIGAPAHYAESIGAALRVENLLEEAREAGTEPDQAQLADAEQQLAVVLAKHAPDTEQVTDATVVPDEQPRRVIIPEPPEPPLTVPSDWADGSTS